MESFTDLIKLYKAYSHSDVIRLIEKDVDLNQFTILHDKYHKIYIPKTIPEPMPCLSAHTDTVHLFSPQTIQKHKSRLSAKEGLGGDDRNGCWLIRQMMLKRPADFIFALFDLEERGCVGSQALDVMPLLDIVSVFIGLDRKGKNELALYGYENMDMLAVLEEIEGYHITFGTVTDVAILSEKTGICCFNLSVGYYQQHSKKEFTRLQHLRLAERFLHSLPSAFWGKQFITDEYMSGYADPFYDLEVIHKEVTYG